MFVERGRREGEGCCGIKIGCREKQGILGVEIPQEKWEIGVKLLHEVCLGKNPSWGCAFGSPRLDGNGLGPNDRDDSSPDVQCGRDQPRDCSHAEWLSGQPDLSNDGGDTTSGSNQSYEGPGTRIFQGLKPDIVMIQEFNVGGNSPSEIRDWVGSTLELTSAIFGKTSARFPTG